MFGILENLRSLVVTTDFFYSTKLLRYQQDHQYKTFTGGTVSLAIIITILIGFANMILNTLNLNTFTISTETVKNVVPTPSNIEITEESQFRFGVEIWRHNLSDTKRYFDVTFRLDYTVYGIVTEKTYYPLETCTREFWKKYPDVHNNFDSLQAGYWLCPTLNTTLHLQGKYSSASYTHYLLQVSACKNETDPSRPCASREQIQQYFIDNANFIYFTVYFSNTQINADKKTYKEYYIEDTNYVIFGNTTGSETFLYFSDYTVKTDESIWPFANVKQDKGCYAQENAINHPYQTSLDDIFVTFSIVKSLNSVIYLRQVQKLSVVFSFIGGMIGAVSAVLFVIKYYTNISYEFAIAFDIFKKKSKKEISKQRPKSHKITKTETQQAHQQKPEGLMEMNFFNFLRYYIYIFITYLNSKYQKPNMQYARQCKQEILKQLDVKMLLKRIIFIEHCLTYLIDDYQLDALQVKKPQNLQEIRKTRMKCQSLIESQLMFDYYKSGQFAQNKKPKTENIILQHDINLIEITPQQLIRAQRQTCIRKDRKKRRQNSDLQNDPVIADQPKREQITQCFKISEDRLSGESNNGSFNRIKDISKWKKLRETYLSQLQQNAQMGNQVSFKIWNSLDTSMKNRYIASKDQLALKE